MLSAKLSFIRFLLTLGRMLTPVISIGTNTYVFRYDDVIEVLTRNDVFTISEINDENISRHIGRFLLTLDDGPLYRRNAGILRKSIQKDDPEWIRRIFRQASHEISGKLSGEFDMVSDFTRLVPMSLLKAYFGTPGPSNRKMLEWCRAIFWDAFLNLKSDPEVRENALQCSDGLVNYLADLIALRNEQIRDGLEIEDNILNRLILMQGSEEPSFNDEEILTHIAGTLMAGVETTSKACINILRQFYSRKDILHEARHAAAKDDVERMGQLAFEAFRFQPMMPVLMRYSRTDCTIGSKRKRRIKSGQTVYAVTLSAMFDPRKIEKPKKFKTDRKVNHYLYFGYGLHECLGNYINMISIPEMLIAILRLEGLQPLQAAPEFEGPFPDKWMFRVG